MSKKTFIHAENNNKILSSNEVKLYVSPEPEKMKVIIWGKELCSGAEWCDFLKCVEEKTRELDQLKQQLAEKDKEIERLKVFEKAYYFNQLQASQKDIQQFQQLANQSAVNINHIAITELKKVKEKINKLPITDILDTDYGGFKKIYQTDAIRIIDQQINELKGEKDAED